MTLEYCRDNSDNQTTVNKMAFSQNIRLKIYLATISLFLLQVLSQSVPPSDGGPPSSAISPKYERIGKYEVASPDSVS